MKEREDSWVDQAACRGVDPSFFYPRLDDEVDEEGRIVGRQGEYIDLKLIASLCSSCPVSNECLDYVVSLPYNEEGFWGGLQRKTRRKLRGMMDVTGCEEVAGELADHMCSEDVLCLR